jgi:hypothetical protein
MLMLITNAAVNIIQIVRIYISVKAAVSAANQFKKNPVRITIVIFVACVASIMIILHTLLCEVEHDRAKSMFTAKTL